MKSRTCGQRERPRRRGREACRADHGRAAVVEEVHRQVGDDLAVIAEREPAGRHELAEVGGLDVLGLAKRLERGQLSGGTARTIRSWASEIQISV